jgi:hypothetical protein
MASKKATKFQHSKKALTVADLNEVERALGIKLPEDLRRLYLQTNGGRPIDSYFVIKGTEYIFNDFFPIKYGKGSTLEECYQSLAEDRIIPRHLVPFANDPGGNLYCFSTASEKFGSVWFWDHEAVDRRRSSTRLTSSVAELFAALGPSPDTSDEDLLKDLKKVDEGSFSPLLTKLIKASGDPSNGVRLRNICRKITRAQGNFSLHYDELALLVYDLQFYLFTFSNDVKSIEEYLEIYPEIIAFGGEFRTGGYAPDDIKDWVNERIKQGRIVKKRSGMYVFSGAYIRELKKALAEYD